MPFALQPWLSVRDSKSALEFYREAFRAETTYLLEAGTDSVIARLSVNGAEFWIADESPSFGNYSPASLGGSTTRMILIVADPEAIMAQAIRAGATEVFPVGIAHGWKTGRIADPFGHHWEIGHMV
jgi:PhnB protein